MLSWLPLYPAAKLIACSIFLGSRLSVSSSTILETYLPIVRVLPEADIRSHQSSSRIYSSFLVPLLRRYESPIDLTILLFRSLAILIGHFFVRLPMQLTWQALVEVAGTIMRAAISSIGSLEDKKAEAHCDHADVDPDAIVEVTPWRSESRSVLRLSPSRSAQLRCTRSLQMPLDGPPSPALTVSDTDESVSRPRTPPARRTGIATLKVPTAPQSLRRSPRRRLNDSSIRCEIDRHVNGQQVESISGQPEIALLSSTSESRATTRKVDNKSFSNSFLQPEPTVRPIRATRKAAKNPKAESRVDGIKLIDVPLKRVVARTAAPSRTQPDLVFSESQDLHQPKSDVFRDFLPSAPALDGMGRAKTFRTIVTKTLIDPATGRATRLKQNSSIYPKLPTPLPLQVSSVNTLAKRLARPNAALRSKTVRISARVVEPLIGKGGEKRRLADREVGEKRSVKKVRVDAHADG